MNLLSILSKILMYTHFHSNCPENLFVLRLNFPVNIFSVMSGRSPENESTQSSQNLQCGK